MSINLKTKIWLTVLAVVIMFSFFTLYYFPRQQGLLLIKNYNTEIQNLANTVALGVRIAITEQNFEGVQTAMEFVKDDPRLQFVSMLQYDTVWNGGHRSFQIKKTIFKTYPEQEHPDPNIQSGNSIVVKSGPFRTPAMSGAILLAFNTKGINESKKKIRMESLEVSGVVLAVGILLGLVLARNISIPVLELRDAAKRVGEGDLNQKVKKIPNDEIGELGKAFNNMVDDLSKARTELDANNQTLSETNARLNNTLLELKSTQVQLIQSEKMASLGELTAGIAHEIQNPLNFVNNFSEVNSELIEEMTNELNAGNDKEAISIAENIKENQEKITHHGKRADAIVKGMLHHSRTSAGQKELTDINALADEYLRLSYHGLRAKDKAFNANYKTNFDQKLSLPEGKINIISQDIGRVLLNLFNNAFYAVMEKSRAFEAGSDSEGANGVHYEPLVTVTTKKITIIPGSCRVEIRIKDNGFGISKKVIDKIYQPFFTTKPTGQGTGLGLSLSYDIIKAHGGEIKIETVENEFAEFIIELPC
ncbi:MAG: ATP-binding protein [Bacteroidota bacterium]|nr:ATP-binding protein [Bacteroidota bacterium]MDQ6888745.1 ATP-binding protein [Bacteroidota bacterium]